MEDLPNDVETLKAIIKSLLERIKHLEVENAELRRRLGLNSTNSHKPPSSDGYAKKVIRAGLPKDKQAKGGQQGHLGKTLNRVECPDHIELHLPKPCLCCGRPFSKEEAHEVIQSRQVFDLPSQRLEVTEHRLVQIECCGTKQCGAYSAEVTASVQYGARVRALITKLSVDHKMPLEQISQLFEDIYGYNSTTIEDTLKRGYALAEPFEHQVKEWLLKENTVHFDETGVRAGGKLHWLHTASSGNYTHLFIDEKRGMLALSSEASVLKDYQGTAVHDCWSPYFNFDNANHSLCGAHLLRELNSLEENDSLWAGEMREFLLDVYRMPKPVKAVTQLYQHYHIILSQAELEEPPPQPTQRGKSKQSVGRNLLNRLKKYENEVLVFAFKVDVPFTNNQAERDLRPAKVKQKVGGGFRTQEGAQVYARLQAAISTFRKQRMNVFSTLYDLFLHHPISLACEG